MMFAALLLCLAPVAPDGDTIRCGSSRQSVRLYGVLSVDGTPEDAASRVELSGLVYGGVTCTPAPTGPVTSYSRVVMVCRNAAGLDVGRELIVRGKAAEACSFTQSRAYPRGYYGTCP